MKAVAAFIAPNTKKPHPYPPIPPDADLCPTFPSLIQEFGKEIESL